MKKTLITLLALAGVALGTSQSVTPQSELTSAIAAAGYNVGDEFTLTFTITSSNYENVTAPVLTLANNWHLGSQGGAYLGFDSGAVTSDGKLSLSGNLSATVDGTPVSYTSSNDDEAVGTISIGSEGWFYFLNHSNKTVSGLTFTITEDSIKIVEDTTAIADFSIDTTTTALNLNDIAFGNRVYGISNLSVSVPEPTTATLSLLALAGLAARRRRK